MPAPGRTTFIDRVDDADRPVGRVRRGDVFAEHANFRTVHVLVFDAAGRLLLQRLSASRERHPLRWGSSVAGYLHRGETYEHAADRRLCEEIGVRAAVHAIGRTAMEDQGVTKFVGVFSTVVDTAEPTIRDSGHVDRLRWVDLSELHSEIAKHAESFTPTLRHVLRFYLATAR